MKIIRPSFEIMSDIKDDLICFIEYIGRVCYKSENNITEETAKTFVERLIKSKHESVIEHASVTVKFVVDRGISHELVRHRLASFSQESTRYCVAGDTMLTFKNPHHKLSIQELYQNKINSKNASWKRLKIKAMNEDGELYFSKIKNVYNHGIKNIIRIKTKLGYILECTSDHEIYTKDFGYKQAGTLKCNIHSIAVNGQHSLYRNKEWLHNQYILLNKTSVQISNETGFSTSVIKKWVKKHKLDKKPKSYWNKGKIPWNKGLTENDDFRVLSQANALRKYHNNGRTENIPKKDRIKKLSKFTYHKLVEDSCKLCDSKINLQVHHLDENRENNSLSNLITLCSSCHAGLHTKNIKYIFYDEIISIENAGSKEVYDIEMNDETHNFVANGVIVHNCNYSKDKFDNQLTFIKPPWVEDVVLDIERFDHWNTNIDGSSGYLYSSKTTESVPVLCQTAIWLNSLNVIERDYLELIERGWTPQQARTILPNSLKTEVIMTANLREWLHVFKLRTSQAAHPQMREVMIPLLEKFKESIPIIFDDIKEN